jgi:hypothetical protein
MKPDASPQEWASEIVFIYNDKECYKKRCLASVKLFAERLSWNASARSVMRELAPLKA